jgi:hypothetical protein
MLVIGLEKKRQYTDPADGYDDEVAKIPSDGVDNHVGEEEPCNNGAVKDEVGNEFTFENDEVPEGFDLEGVVDFVFSVPGGFDPIAFQQFVHVILREAWA